MVHRLGYGQQWADPGLNISDNMDTTLNIQEARLYSGVVDTTVPTLPGLPVLLTYCVVDASGNVAEPVGRELHVGCPDGEEVCPGDEWESRPSCSVLGKCLASSNGFTSTLLGANFPRLTISTAEPVEIKLRLVGDNVVEVPVGGEYVKCPRGAAPAEICDAGAVALVGDNDISAGSLTCLVEACGRSFHKYGLSGCAIDTSSPGSFEVEFSVTDPLEPQRREAVRRIILVVPECENGEVFCDNTMSCSTGGICLSSVDSLVTLLFAQVTPAPECLSMFETRLGTVCHGVARGRKEAYEKSGTKQSRVGGVSEEEAQGGDG